MLLRLLKRGFCVKRDYYKVLQVSINASQAEIKAKYLQLAKLYHPDRSKGTEEKFKIINEAYEVIGDPQQRKEYDNSNFGESATGERYARSTYNSNFHYAAGRTARQTSGSNSRSWQAYGRSTRPHQQSYFYEEYLRSERDAQREFREDLDRQYRQSRYKWRNIFLGSFAACFLFEMFLRWQSGSRATYQVIDPHTGVIYYTTSDNMRRLNEQRDARMRRRHREFQQDEQ